MDFISAFPKKLVVMDSCVDDDDDLVVFIKGECKVQIRRDFSELKVVCVCDGVSSACVICMCHLFVYLYKQSLQWKFRVLKGT